MNGKQDKLSFSDSVPDNITSWTVSGFALSPTLGLGIIKQPLTLVVKKPLFYIVLNLPHSIKRYGEATIQVTIYNILENALSTEVTLFNKNNEIEFVGQSSNDTKLFDTPISNLESLVHLPTGNGEQNIAKFASNIVILDYLSESEKLSEKNRTKVIDYLQSGYQNQLKYKRSDGSFGVQGASDTKGGTFITAFVVMSFSIAKTYIDIDWSIVEDALRWLASIQTHEGTFNEVGRVTEANVRGGVGSTKYSLTANCFVVGGFPRTQDIFVGLKALTKYTAEKSSRNNYRAFLVSEAATLQWHMITIKISK
ncbi:thioester-containing protein 1 allele R1-like [Sabethes cyaneus]|uniref:thioester-containing protein 1 allele R1-like n=1 Tax=Sabethes cyaneus TaxID=53552 RepID=UPI00237D3BE6|nr:thioester-containing protein 1 allele R1-like [Sabethes cyaneus]